MDLSTVIQNRRSIRKFKPDPISNEDLYTIIEAARLAPSGLNVQPWRFIIVKTQSVREALAKLTPSTFIAQAPVVLLCCIDTQSFDSLGLRFQELNAVHAFEGTLHQNLSPADLLTWVEPNDLRVLAQPHINTAIALEHIALKATDLGLGSCWIHIFDQAKVRQIIPLDHRYAIIALMPIGYPDQTPGPRPRLPLAELILGEA